jgi:hypothetical protein
VGQDLLDDRGLIDESDDPHGAATLGAQQRVSFIEKISTKKRLRWRKKGLRSYRVEIIPVAALPTWILIR